MSLKMRRREEDARLSDKVYETLLDAIVSGRLAPASVVSELALAAELKVSRTPIHDALRQLGKDGLVVQEAGRRAVVAKLSADDVYDVYEMRKILEGEAAARAAKRIDRPTLAGLQAMAEQLERSRDGSGWLLQWADFDEEFHTAIARASGSPRLSQDISRYRLLHRALNKFATKKTDLRRALQEHLVILKALAERKPDEAKKAMLDHLHEWQAYFVNQFPR